MRTIAFPVVVLAIVGTAFAQQPKAIVAPSPGRGVISMERYPGGSVVTDLGYNIKTNKDSTLKREWFVVRDDAAPASVDGAAGIDVQYKSGERYSSGQYQYHIGYTVRAKEPIAAIELRVHVFDVFGKLIKTLSATELTDFSDSRSFDGNWHIWSENEASEAFASVAYIAQVRTASGRVYEAERSAIFDQVRKVGRRITEADLEPKREPPAGQK
ncbi:MAG: hypothetical protein WA190_00130 [Usitatibacter sp.]